MSFCRWSSMDFQCDLYCYESDQGFVTHVAKTRVVGDIPKLNWNLITPPITEDMISEFVRVQNEQFEFLETAERKPIGLAFDGLSFTDDKEGFLVRLDMLRKEGYNFPEITEEDLEDE